MDRPEWVKKYKQVMGFPENWADSALRKHKTEFVNNVSDEISPLNSINKFDIKSFEDNRNNFLHTFNRLDNIDEIFLCIDLIKCFSKYMPEEDKELYSLYEKIFDSPHFNFKAEFPEFYTFCRKIQYMKIENTEIYNSIRMAYNKYSFYDSEPSKGSIWKISEDGHKYKVKVEGKISISEKNILDPEVYCKILDVCDGKDGCIDIGSYRSFAPIYFNEGSRLDS